MRLSTPSPETFKYGDWPFQGVSCPYHKTRAPRREYIVRISEPHCQPRSAVGPLIAPRQKLPRVGGVVGQPVPARQASLAAPSRLEFRRTRAFCRFDRVHRSPSQTSACSHPFPAPTITSLNRHHHPIPRCWRSVAPAPCLGQDPGSLASFGPVGRHACNATRFGTAGGSACCRVSRLPSPNGMGPGSQEKIPPLCSIQHGNAQQKKLTARTEDPAGLELFTLGLRCWGPSHLTEATVSIPTAQGSPNRAFDWSRGIGASLKGLTNVDVGFGVRHPEEFRPTPCWIGTVPGAGRGGQNRSRTGLLWVMGIPPGVSAPCKQEAKLGLVGEFPLIPTGATVVFFHTRGLLRFGEGLGHWRTRLRCLTANGSTPSPTRAGDSFALQGVFALR